MVIDDLRRCRTKLAAGLLLPAALALSAVLAPAAAASVSVEVSSTEGLRISANGGSHVQVHTSDSTGAPTLVVVEVAHGAMTAGAGCTQGDSALGGTTFVRCSVPPLRFVTFNGSLGVDRLTLTPGVGDCLCTGSGSSDVITGSDGADLIRGSDGNDVVTGGDGGDVLTGGDGDDTLSAGAGNDSAQGGAGDDTLTGGAGNDSAEGGDGGDLFEMGALPDGADTLDGGLGVDTVSYAGRRGAVTATIDGSANDGASAIDQLVSEGDNVALTVERLTGGAGGDTLIGSSQPNRLVGGAGNDLLRGGSPAFGARGADTAADDVLDGGVGSDGLKGEGGRDTLLARDAIDDQTDTVLSCGTGPGAAIDTLDADVRDDDTRELPVDCESGDQGMVGEDPNVHIRLARRAAGGGLIVELRCPRKTRRGCAGKLAVMRLAAKSGARRGFPSGVRYAVRRGKRGLVRVPGRTRGVDRAGAAIRIRSVERGRLGPRTTFRTLTVRR